MASDVRGAASMAVCWPTSSISKTIAGLRSCAATRTSRASSAWWSGLSCVSPSSTKCADRTAASNVCSSTNTVPFQILPTSGCSRWSGARQEEEAQPSTAQRTAAAAILDGTPAAARVVGVEIASRESVLGGREFGAVGAYERLSGRVYFALDPANPHNRAIVDLERATRSSSGAVEFAADLIVLRPKEVARSNGSLIVDVPNRGGMLTGRNVIAKDTDVDAYYLRNGYTIAGVGWQFDVRPDKDLLHLQAPIARGLTGRVRADFVVPARVLEHTVSHVIQDQVGGIGYPVADPHDATLTERDAPLAARRLVPPSKWRSP